jgi:hypothetical protein
VNGSQGRDEIGGFVIFKVIFPNLFLSPGGGGRGLVLRHGARSPGPHSSLISDATSALLLGKRSSVLELLAIPVHWNVLSVLSDERGNTCCAVHLCFFITIEKRGYFQIIYIFYWVCFLK